VTGYEYRSVEVPIDHGAVDSRELEERLDGLGKEGWELVSVTPILLQGDTVRLIYHLRRMSQPERRAGFNA
jgi:hypothetical protein